MQNKAQYNRVVWHKYDRMERFELWMPILDIFDIFGHVNIVKSLNNVKYEQTGEPYIR